MGLTATEQGGTLNLRNTLNLTETAAPGAPAANTIRLYAKTDHTLHAYLNGVDVALGGTSGAVSLQAATPGTADTGHLNITGTGIMGTMYAGTGSTLPADSSISTVAAIGKNGAGETAILTLYNSHAAADGDTAILSFVHGGFTLATAEIRSVVEGAGSGLTGIGFSTYNSGLAERHRMRSDGRVGFGIHSPFAILHVCSQPTYNLGEMIAEQATIDTVGPAYWFRKSRGSIDTPVQPTTGDTLGTITWTGYGSGGGTSANLDSRVYISGAQIRVDSIGTIAATRVAGIMRFLTGTNAAPTVLTEALRLTETQSCVLNNAALATGATDGFLYIATCAGAPTGVPTAFTGRVAMIYDTTNHFLYFYEGGAWKKSTVYA